VVLVVLLDQTMGQMVIIQHSQQLLLLAVDMGQHFQTAEEMVDLEEEHLGVELVALEILLSYLHRKAIMVAMPHLVVVLLEAEEHLLLEQMVLLLEVTEVLALLMQLLDQLHIMLAEEVAEAA
jgi:hypothetical protein